MDKDILEGARKLSEELARAFHNGYLMGYEKGLGENTQSLERTDIKRSEPPLEQGENPCVNIKQQTKSEILKDYE
jgi:hypothetical protein